MVSLCVRIHKSWIDGGNRLGGGGGQQKTEREKGTDRQTYRQSQRDSETNKQIALTKMKRERQREIRTQS